MLKSANLPRYYASGYSQPREKVADPGPAISIKGSRQQEACELLLSQLITILYSGSNIVSQHLTCIKQVIIYCVFCLKKIYINKHLRSLLQTSVFSNYMTNAILIVDIQRDNHLQVVAISPHKHAKISLFSCIRLCSFGFHSYCTPMMNYTDLY